MAVPTIIADQQGRTPFLNHRAKASDAGFVDITPFAANLTQIAGIIDKRDSENQAMWVNQQFNEGRLHMMNRIEELQNNAKPGAPGFRMQVMKEYEDFVNGVIKTAPSKQAGNALLEHFNQLAPSILSTANKFEQQEGIIKMTSDVNRNVDVLGLSLDKQPALYPQLYESGEKFITQYQGKIPPSEVERLKARLPELAMASINGYERQSPLMALEAIKSGMYDGKIDTLHLQNKRDQLEAEVNKLSTYKAAEIDGDIREYRSIVEDNGTNPVRAQEIETKIMKSVSDPEKRDFILKEFRHQEDLGNQTYQWKDKVRQSDYSIQNRGKIEDEMFKWVDSKSGDSTRRDERKDIYDKWMSWQMQDMAAMVRDPGGYFQQNDKTVKGAYMNVEALKAAKAPAQAIAEANQEATVLNMHAQARAGFSTPVPMGKGQAQSIVASIQKAATTDPETMISEFNGLEHNFGKSQYTAVMRQLEDEKLDPLYEAIGLVKDNPRAVYQLSRAIGTDPKALEAVAPDAETKSSISQDINNRLDRYTRSLNAIPGQNVEKVANTGRAIEQLARFMVFNREAKNLSDGIKKATDLVVPYDFGESNGIPFAIPKHNRDKTKINMIESRALTWLDYYEDKPDTFFKFEDFGGNEQMLPESRKLLFNSHFRSNAFWAIAPNNEGVELWMNVDGEVRKLRDRKNGRPIYKPFIQLEADGPPVEGPFDLRYKKTKIEPMGALEGGLYPGI